MSAASRSRKSARPADAYVTDQHLEQVVADAVRLLGPDHQDTVTTRANLASSCRQVGRASGAITIEEQVVADRERLLGQHRDVPGT